MNDLSQLPPIQMPKASAPNAQPAAPDSTSVVKAAAGWIHPLVTVAMLGAGGYVATQPSSTPAPATEPSKPTPAKPDATPKAEPPARVQPSAYEVKLIEAHELEIGAFDVYRKRLIYLYRGVIAHAKTAKTQTELKAAFAAEEKRLDMQGRLTLIRAVAKKEWAARIQPEEMTPATRASIVEFFTQTIAILERLQ